MDELVFVLEGCMKGGDIITHWKCHDMIAKGESELPARLSMLARLRYGAEKTKTEESQD
jgi:hypothetical protein